MQWQGNLCNRLEENRMFCDKIEVGTPATKYSWSDRTPYEVISVQDQKHVTIRVMDHKHVGDGQMDNKWELISNEYNPTICIVKRGNYWYETHTITAEQLEKFDATERLYCAINGFDPKVIAAKGKQTKYIRINISFGVAEFYYDYEF